MVLKRKHNSFCREVFFFIFLMFLLQESIRFDAILIILGYFAQKTV